MDFQMRIIISFGLALVLTPIAASIGRAIRLVDKPGSLKIHARATPLTGGLAVAAAIGIAMAAGTEDWGWFLPAALVAALALGVADDYAGLPPILRIGIIAAIGVFLAAGVIPIPIHPAAILSVVLLTLAATNAVNLMDGQNGLAGGLGAIASGGLAVISLLAGDSKAGAVGICTSGALIGFLFWNYPRARIFLGNGGAYLVGAVLSYQALAITLVEGFKGLIVAGACLGVFALEFAVTVYRRAFSRSRITAGDRFHAYDILAKRFGGRTRVTLAFWGFGLLLALFSILLSRMPLSAGIGGALVGAVVCAGSALAITRIVNKGVASVDQ
jgi:UDP-GlcNAc:undecaprenyl-phosphate GlcNAc-1-phosphate transferase